MENQRTTGRIPFADQVTFLAPQRFVAKAVDIGAGGIGVETPVLLNPYDHVEIEIMEGRAVALGEVRWVRQEGGRYRAGIKFREEDWSIIELIDALRNQED